MVSVSYTNKELVEQGVLPEYALKGPTDSIAVTLNDFEVNGSNEDREWILSSRTNESGWTITGVISEDHYLWVSDFAANHNQYGVVAGNFEKTIYATSKEGLEHFVKYHKPKIWDYHDI